MTRIRHNQREKENDIDDILITTIDREDYFAHLLVDSLGKQQASRNYCASTSFEASNHKAYQMLLKNGFLSFQIMIILQYSSLLLVILSVLLRPASPKGKAPAKILWSVGIAVSDRSSKSCIAWWWCLLRWWSTGTCSCGIISNHGLFRSMSTALDRTCRAAEADISVPNLCISLAQMSIHGQTASENYLVQRRSTIFTGTLRIGKGTSRTSPSAFRLFSSFLSIIFTSTSRKWRCTTQASTHVWWRTMSVVSIGRFN